MGFFLETGLASNDRPVYINPHSHLLAYFLPPKRRMLGTELGSEEGFGFINTAVQQLSMLAACAKGELPAGDTNNRGACVQPWHLVNEQGEWNTDRGIRMSATQAAMINASEPETETVWSVMRELHRWKGAEAADVLRRGEVVGAQVAQRMPPAPRACLPGA